MKKPMLAAIKARHCTRSFLKKQVPKSSLETILLAARQAASSKNTQPWQVYVLQNKKRHALEALMCEKFDTGITEPADYIYTNMPQLFLDRARACGHALFKHKNINPKDIAARRAHNKENFRFFGAPTALIFYLNEGAQPGNFLDMGLFMQNIVLGLADKGMGSCPQYSITRYSQSIKKELNIPAKNILVCGMAVGYPNKKAAVNTFRPERLALKDFVQWD